MIARVEPIHVVRAADTRACCDQLRRVPLYRRAEGRREVVHAMICPVHGVDGRSARAKAPARACGIHAFKHQALPGRP